eukprot:GILK01003957.1.p1 GENE.GILK01003957.1~~GILK01003957.1.p1  ORF type:complete len:110 (+),score=4.44 GILK01003957.1:111-440(+)
MCYGDTVEDGTIVPPNIEVDKTWTFHNCGSRSWPWGMYVGHVCGPLFGLEAQRQLAKLPTLKPGALLKLTFRFVTPATAGTYATMFTIRLPNGQDIFDFWIKFNVQEIS